MPDGLGRGLDAPLFERVVIIGVGLIGSSLARVARRKNLARTIVACDRSAAVRERVVALGLADETYEAPAEAVRGADFVILCVPVGACGGVAEQMKEGLAPGVIVSDVGSVKQSVVNQVAPHLPENALFVPAHPVAGTENSGPDAGFATLFKGRWCILTPPGGSDAATDRVRAFWEGAGSNVEVMTPAHHDLVLAITSHVPHLIAYNIVGTAADLEEVTQSEVIKFSAGGFRDFTRIAASDPTMWRDVFLNNKDAVLEMLGRFSEDLTALQRAIRWGDGDALFNLFTRTRAIRRSIIDVGQETAEPDFGRRKVDEA
ncbi:prephenate/arogenate dehydrogenase family protein [Alsobacter sp. SYSU M60028]|uniref:Prephenate/arogenate dehydrogenase family protein n=1 Tax=Alsobacter ponti TaxID=2962936 RepID=A0ABT1LEQ1_9HYPH|nr:prephenate/arogenate dehydrogenase family protein [Alsobacter ponti]